MATTSERATRALVEAVSAGSVGLAAIWDDGPPNSPSDAISRFPERRCCWQCFAQQHQLHRGAVRRLYTSSDRVFEPLNVALSHADRQRCDAFTVAFTQLLADALVERQQRRPPKRVFRGLSQFAPQLVAAYEARVGERVYYHSFTSTSTDASTALRFAQPSGWRLVIDLPGAAECAASVAHLSDFDEQECQRSLA